VNAKRVNAAAGVIHGSQVAGRQTAAGLAADLESACMLQSPETAAEQEQLRNDITGACLARWEEEQENARLRLALESAKRGRREARGLLEITEDSRKRWRDAEIESAKELKALRARVAELEKREAVVAEFVADRAGYITAINNCHPDNAHDYNRWQGHAESRRQLAGQLGLPVAWPSGYGQDATPEASRSADRLRALLAPSQASRESEAAPKCRCAEPDADPYACEADDCTGEFSELNPFGGGPVQGNDAKVSRTCGCGWTTTVWHVADGSAEAELHGHVVRVHGGVYPVGVAQ